jgi:sucrose-6-phosphate hydrolase SacC (GH32 family)
MPFNQQMTVPRELSLRATPDGIRLFIEPVKEVATLRGKEHTWTDVELGDVSVMPLGVSGGQLDIELVLEPGQAKRVGLELGGQRIEYAVQEQQLTALASKAPLPLKDGRIELRILLDRTSLEVFANRGSVSMASCFLPPAAEADLRLYAEGGAARAPSVRVWEMRSIWP